MLRRWLLYGLCTQLLLSCGEPVPVDCTPDEEQCTSETEGGFETGTVAGVAAGGAAVIALVGGGDEREVLVVGHQAQPLPLFQQQLRSESCLTAWWLASALKPAVV